MAKNLDKEFQFYLDHREDLIKEYLGRYLVIKDQEVIEDFSEESDAYEFGKEKFGLGNFLIQHCVANDDSITKTFHSRVEFI